MLNVNLNFSAAIVTHKKYISEISAKVKLPEAMEKLYIITSRVSALSCSRTGRSLCCRQPRAHRCDR